VRLHRLHVIDFAAIQDADIEFGPGVNVLYGPNDLGKSTLAEAIRLALLLPHTSTHIEDYVPWAGGRDPVLEITFETEPQRIWRVRKEFRRGGAALLQESRNGVDFHDVERARKVDGKLRELLSWGIPEPGGAGGSKGLPTSFLATVLLSTQSRVTAVLKESLQADPSGTGRERIAAALQAVAQDPLFVALLRATQERRDHAYTDKGAKKTAKGSVFKTAADRLNQARDERDRYQKAVDDSEAVEKQLDDLTAKRGQREQAVAVVMERLVTLERLVEQGAALGAAAEEVRLAREEVVRIRAIGSEVDMAAQTVEDLGRKTVAAEEALEAAQLQEAEAATVLESAEEAARLTGLAPGVADTVARQSLELRKAAADQTSRKAQQQIDAATVARKLIDAAAAVDRDHQAQRMEADDARSSLTDTAAKERTAVEQVSRVELLERALDARTADERICVAQAEVERCTALRLRIEAMLRERDVLVERRAAISVPAPAALTSAQRLATDLAGARGALNVGLVVTITPNRPVDIRVKKDGTAADSGLRSEALSLEANAEVDIDVGDVANVRVRGGRSEAQQTVDSLEIRWSREVAPHLAAANVADLDGLSAKIAEAQELGTTVKANDAEVRSLQMQIDALADSGQRLREALDRKIACRTALGDVPLETLASDLATLGADPAGVLRGQRQRAARELEQGRTTANQARIAFTLAEERTRNSAAALQAAVTARDAALAAFPEGVEATLSASLAALAAAMGEQDAAVAELTSLEGLIAAQNERVEAAIRNARLVAGQASARVDVALAGRTKAITDHASQAGRLEELRKLRDAQDLTAAESRLQAATNRHAALPVPERAVDVAEVTDAQNAEAMAKSDLGAIEREIQRTHGALEQVGGTVARERLRDAIEAFELAEWQEREIEADYEAWLLLLEQMKQADAAQASNLGQTLAPAITSRFEALTQRRYGDVRLTAQLGTEGVVVAGAVRSTERISVGTREQLSALYRLSIAEYLQTTVVLDDQLVQSDVTRMDWFRGMLAEKAHSFQIVVFTCRPGDYLAANAMVPSGRDVHRDTDGGFVRAVDLCRAVRPLFQRLD
jgi:energy-coupling factor transporter ATP-binding protein EcfA2